MRWTKDGELPSFRKSGTHLAFGESTKNSPNRGSPYSSMMPGVESTVSMRRFGGRSDGFGVGHAVVILDLDGKGGLCHLFLLLRMSGLRASLLKYPLSFLPGKPIEAARGELLFDLLKSLLNGRARFGTTLVDAPGNVDRFVEGHGVSGSVLTGFISRS